MSTKYSDRRHTVDNKLIKQLLVQHREKLQRYESEMRRSLWATRCEYCSSLHGCDKCSL